MPEADQPSSSKQDRPKSTSDAQNLASIVADIFRMAEAGEIDQYTTDHLLEQLYATGRDPTPEPVRTPEIVQMQSYHQALYPASGSIEKYRSPSTKTTNTDDSNVDHDNVSGSLMNAGMVSPNFSEGRKSNNPFYALSVAARAPATSAEPSSVLDRSSPPAEKNSRDDDDFALNPSSAASRSAIPNLVTPHPNEQLRSGSVERRGFGAPPPTDDRQPRPRPPSQDSLSHGEPPPPNPYLSGPDSRGNSVDSVAEMLGDLLVEGGAEATKTDTVDSTSPAAKEKERLRKRAVFKRVFKKDKETKSAKA
ncbi:hypothetical protein BKA70DRAFT_1285399 [Coprinopsis sp. MPI-PUGE-AT-0042]|nr:hypothetical protein BKA70DRAFT_1285399 [Coprinopsis sp. MPI-PUGE-AT-0042]